MDSLTAVIFLSAVVSLGLISTVLGVTGRRERIDPPGVEDHSAASRVR